MKQIQWIMHLRWASNKSVWGDKVCPRSGGMATLDLSDTTHGQVKSGSPLCVTRSYGKDAKPAGAMWPCINLGRLVGTEMTDYKPADEAFGRQGSATLTQAGEGHSYISRHQHHLDTRPTTTGWTSYLSPQIFGYNLVRCQDRIWPLVIECIFTPELIWPSVDMALS